MKKKKGTPNCEDCKMKSCLKTGTPCNEVENWLRRKQPDDSYSWRHIMRKEIPYDPQHIIWIDERQNYTKGRWVRVSRDVDSD